DHWLMDVVMKPESNGHHASAALEFGLLGFSIVIAAVSAGVAYHFYVNSPAWPARIVGRLKGVHHLLYNKYFVDELYEKTIIGPLVRASQGLWAYVDVNFIDRATYV